MKFLSSAWNWITGQPELPEIPSNIIFEKDVSPDNNFWITCILDPSLDVNYVNGTVTKIIDTDKCIINGIYHYQPKTEKEIQNFPFIELNSSVRISIYRKKNSNSEWKVASCFLSSDKRHHPANVIRQNDSVRVHLNDDEPNVQIDQTVEENNEKSPLTVEVIGCMPKVVNFEGESTIQILFRNDSYVKEHELLDYQTMQTNRAQLSIVNKVKLPLIIGIQSQYIFDINLQGKYLGRSTEKVVFFFKDINYKVGINIDVTDSRIIIPYNTGYCPRNTIDIQKLFELQNDNLVSGVRLSKRVQFQAVKLKLFNIPSALQKCFWKDDAKFVRNFDEIQENISKCYAAAFEILTYQNYRAKFHTLLFMDEIEVTITLQKYAHERIHFEHRGEYLVLNIPNLSEQRPSLIPGDRAVVTDPPNCTRRLGEPGKYEGIIHKILADEIWLKFDPEFHGICGHWEYSVNFFNARMIYRKQHEVIDELWKKNRLGESFLFPYKDSLEYQPPKLKILSLDENNTDINPVDNLNENKALLPKPKIIQKIRWFYDKLNREQKTAVINVLKGEGRPMPYIIYGPPGTGKTLTLTETIIQVYKEFPQSKLLVCAPTNSAVDLLLGKLINSGLFDKTVMKRLVGFSHFISPSYNMDYDEYCVLPELEISNYQSNVEDPRLIKKRDILKLRIVITTEGSAGILYMMGLKGGVFSHIFIDEAGQSTEPETLLPLAFLDPLKNGQVVLAGDPKQLGPVVLSSMAKNNGLGQSMLGRFINYPSYQRDTNIFPEYNGYNPKVLTHLIWNYRSLPEIVNVFSKLFYNSLLVSTKTDDDVKERIMLNNLNENTHWDIGCKGPIIIHGIEGEDRQEPSSPSWFNPHEAFQVLLYVTRLMKAGISANDIGIITPYSSQVSKVNELLTMYYPNITLPKVGTVEMFQGQERMVIIISIVRSKSAAGREKDKKFRIGFLAAQERTNVALSRAKALLIVVGDPSTMVLNNKWKKVLFDAISKNNYLGCNVPDYYLERKKREQNDY